MNRKQLFLASSLLLAASCGPKTGTQEPTENANTSMQSEVPPGAASDAKQVATTLEAVGLDGASIDRSVDPCQNFYQFACGGWIKANEIPADKSRWGRFAEIAKRNELTLHDILEKTRTVQGGDAVAQKLGAYYGACMDEAGIEKAGLKSLAPLQATIKQVKDVKTLQAAITALHQNKVWAVFDINASQDMKNTTQVIAELDQNGLGLPDRDYYLLDDKKDIRTKYVAHVEKMLVLGGLKPAAAKKAAADVMTLETELAKISKTKVERRDPEGLYNKIDRAGLIKATPSFGWDAYFTAIGIPDAKDANVTSVAFFEGVDKLLKTVKPAQWQSYLTWQLLDANADTLPKAFVDQDFSMTQVLSGQPQIEDRWKRCIKATDAALGELLGVAFVERSFQGESKTYTEKLVAQIGQSFVGAVDQLQWMDPGTRERAKEKFTKMVFKIGYPAAPKAYAFDVKGDDFAGNVGRARGWDLQFKLAKIGKPVDRAQWLMSAPTVNAYYEPTMNEMVFPAGILQSPFFSAKASDAVNLGGIGMVVGHELTHGFDDQGSQFAGDGNLKSWWDPKTVEAFKGKTACVADQYSQYEAVPGVKINGKLTNGENIADMGGVKLAFRAYRSLRAGASETAVADGFSEDQQFFLSVGQIWCSSYREEAAKLQAQTDPHSAPQWRVNGSLSNLPEFWQAFSCSEGTQMHPKNTCEVW